MKLSSVAAAVTLSLTLTSCGWNPFHKMCSATAEIQILPKGIPDVVSLAPATGEPDAATQLAREIEAIHSPEILTPVIEHLKLDQIWAKRFQHELSSQEVLNHLDQLLKFEVVPQTNIFKVTAYSEVPQEAADIANAVVDTYKAIRDNEEVVRSSRGVDALRDEIAEQQKVLDDMKADIEKHLPNPSQIHDAQRKLDQQQALLDALNVRLKQLIAKGEGNLDESRVRIISHAVPPPE